MKNADVTNSQNKKLFLCHMTYVLSPGINKLKLN